MTPLRSLLLAVAVPLAVCALLWWPVPVRLGSLRPLTAFSDSHVWVFEHLWRGVMEGQPLEPTCAAGYPSARSFRPIAGVPAALWFALRPVLGPLAAANLVQLLALPLTSAATWALLRRVGVGVHAALPLALTFALCPNLLGTFATGEVSNTQGWILPLAGLALLHARARWRGLVSVAAVGLLAALTSPYLALSLPLVLGGTAVLGLGLASLRGARLRLLASVGALGVGLAPAWVLYQPDRAGGGTSLFRPARANPLAGLELPHPAPVATLDSLVWHGAPPPGSPFETVHVAALGLPLVVAAVGGLVWSRREEPGVRRAVAFAAALMAGGVLLSLGPWVGAGGELLALGGRRLPTPVALLELLGWPTRMGGLYFRYSVVAVLGAVLVVGCVAKGTRRWTLGLWLLCLLNVSQAVASSGPLWPRPTAPIAGAAALATLEGRDGAVLELPLQGPTDAHLGQAALLRAVVHRRPTTALPRSVVQPDDPTRRLWRDATRGSDGAAARAVLRERGIRLVVLPTELQEHVRPPRAKLDALLGPPVETEGLLLWDLGPATLQCAAVSPAPPRGPARRPVR